MTAPSVRTPMMVLGLLLVAASCTDDTESSEAPAETSSSTAPTTTSQPEATSSTVDTSFVTAMCEEWEERGTRHTIPDHTERVSCGPGASDGELEDARARWEAAGITDYQLVVHRGCSWQGGIVVEGVIEVSNGSVVESEFAFDDAEAAGQGVSPSECSLAEPLTVADLFEFAEDYLVDGAGYSGLFDTDVAFHVDLGYPAYIAAGRHRSGTDRIVVQELTPR